MHILSVIAYVLLAVVDPSSGRPIDGIRCDQMEGAVFHIHSHLALVDRGRSLLVPSDVGRPLAGRCLYWLHTHTPDGIIHVESPVYRAFTLGQFFDIWGQPLGKNVAASMHATRSAPLVVWVNGRRYTGDPRAIELAQHTDIAIEMGGPARAPAPFTDWQGQ